jgi:hypothetical protein
MNFMQCSCHCIKCGSIDLKSEQIGKIESDGYFDRHHTCRKCNVHFDHLEGDVFDSCKVCGYESS